MELPKWDACALEPNVLLRWMECHPSVTGAAATGLAMLAAACVPLFLWRQDLKHRANEKRQASEAFAASLLSSVLFVQMDLARVGQMITLLGQKAANDPGITDTVRAVRIKIPPRVDQAMAEMHNFDNAIVGRLRTCLTAVFTFNGIVDQLIVAADANVFEPKRNQAVTMLAVSLQQLRQPLAEVTGLDS